MQHPSNRLYRVWQGEKILMHGTLAQCYESYPETACVELGQRTARGLYVEKLEW
jgi:hypothetical protein